MLIINHLRIEIQTDNGLYGFETIFGNGLNIIASDDNTRGKTITYVVQMDDEPGLLSGVLKLIADYKANILTIHQTIPINGIALLTMSIEVLPDTLDVSEMFEAIESRNGVHYIKMLARE